MGPQRQRMALGTSCRATGENERAVAANKWGAVFYFVVVPGDCEVLRNALKQDNPRFHYDASDQHP